MNYFFSGTFFVAAIFFDAAGLPFAVFDVLAEEVFFTAGFAAAAGVSTAIGDALPMPCSAFVNFNGTGSRPITSLITFGR